MAKIVSAALCLALGAILAQNVAAAAMWLRITVDPLAPSVNEPARVTVVTMVAHNNYFVSDPRSSLEPWSEWYDVSGPSTPSFKLVAFQDDRRVEIPLTQRAP
ncbi:MAG TPA: hypothetical protein VGQ77_13460, partial [Methylomirabilota bacterium]|nr:hypothetical protein [Methylomirabilota bacterium]